MTRAHRLAWIGGGAALVAIAIAAVIAWSSGESAPRPPAGPAGPASGAPPADAATRGPREAAVDPHDAAPAAADVEQAARLVASARAETAAGNLVAARSLLVRAYGLDSRPATLLDLAAVEFQTGHCREARRATLRVIAAASGELADQAQQLLGKIGRCD